MVKNCLKFITISFKNQEDIAVKEKMTGYLCPGWREGYDVKTDQPLSAVALPGGLNALIT